MWTETCQIETKLVEKVLRLRLQTEENAVHVFLCTLLFACLCLHTIVCMFCVLCMEFCSELRVEILSEL